MLALTGTTGKIGSAILTAILDHNLISPSSLIICTSSNPSDSKFDDLKARGIQIRHSNYNIPSTMHDAFVGVSTLLLISTPENSLDYNDAPYGEGREKCHFAAIDAAREKGVSHIIYASLAFGLQSKCGVMRAHLRTEKYLKGLGDIKSTIIRQGLYSESWPLYAGFFDTLDDARDEVIVAGDGPISWISLRDLGLANAIVLADARKYEGRFFYLSPRKTYTLTQVMGIVSRIKGREIRLKVVGEREYVEHYVEKGVQREMLEWWVGSYTALSEGECAIGDGISDGLLEGAGVKQKGMEDTVREMLEGGLRGHDKLT